MGFSLGLYSLLGNYLITPQVVFLLGISLSLLILISFSNVKIIIIVPIRNLFFYLQRLFCRLVSELLVDQVFKVHFNSNL